MIDHRCHASAGGAAIQLLCARLIALASVSAVLLAETASASGLVASETFRGDPRPAVTHVVGVAEHIAGGQHPVRGPSQSYIVSGHCVAAATAPAPKALGPVLDSAFLSRRDLRDRQPYAPDAFSIAAVENVKYRVGPPAGTGPSRGVTNPP